MRRKKRTKRTVGNGLPFEGALFMAATQAAPLALERRPRVVQPYIAAGPKPQREVGIRLAPACRAPEGLNGCLFAEV
jgi:hypothetical protein